MGRRLRVLLRRGEEGQALVELALTVPAVMTILTALFAFALAFSNELTLTSAVGVAGENLIKTRNALNSDGTAVLTDPCAQALASIQGAAPSLNPANIGVTLTLNNGTPVTASTCPSAATTMTNKSFDKDPVTVTATYPFILLPIFNFKGGTTGWMLTASVTEYAY
jgi:Flp pilus assembly protein TadG